MSRYIDADKALEDADTIDPKYKTLIEQVKRIINAQPSADVVEVVRKPVKGYEGHYEVDQFGRVYSVSRVIHIVDNSREYDKPITERQLRQSLHSKGYKVVALTLDGVTKTQFVHRLVAEAFIENPDNLPMVNHKDEDKTNNFVDNLEWCTAEYNTNYGNARRKQAKKLKGRPHTEEHKKKISESLKACYCSYGERKEHEDK